MCRYLLVGAPGRIASTDISDAKHGRGRATGVLTKTNLPKIGECDVRSSADTWKSGVPIRRLNDCKSHPDKVSISLCSFNMMQFTHECCISSAGTGTPFYIQDHSIHIWQFHALSRCIEGGMNTYPRYPSCFSPQVFNACMYCT